MLKIFTNKRILIISPESWCHNHVSKHHYASYLATKGNTVFFLNPPSKKNAVSFSGITNLWITDYRPAIRGLNFMPNALRRYFSQSDIHILKTLTGGGFDIVWSFDPYRFQDLRLFKASVKIYYCADLHASPALERFTADTADLVLSPSRSLLGRLKTGAPKHFINHGVAEYFFNADSMTGLPGKGKAKVGYVGNLKSKYLDYSLLKNVIQFNRECDFLFVGDDSGSAFESLKAFENAFFLGPLNNNVIPAFLKACDLLLICYDTDRFEVEASNSHKILEYLASGNAVVSSRILEYLDQPGLILMPKENAGLPELLKNVIDDLGDVNHAYSRGERIAFARNYTYSQQLLRIDSWIDEIHPIFSR